MTFRAAQAAQIRRRGGSWVGYSPPLFKPTARPHTTMKQLLILSAAALCLSSCSWTQSDWQRLTTATTDAAIKSATQIEIDRTSGK